jgi:hypothetical protein
MDHFPITRLEAVTQFLVIMRNRLAVPYLM